MTKFYIQMLVGMALIAALLVWGPAAHAGNPPATVGEEKMVEVLCIKEGIDAVYEASLDSEEAVAGVLNFLLFRGGCMLNTDGYKVKLKTLYKSYEDYEGAGVEIWEVHTEKGPAVFVWNYMGITATGTGSPPGPPGSQEV